MFEVSVRQFLRPDGRERMQAVHLGDEYRSSFQSLCESDCELQAEVLRTGEVSLTVFDLQTEEDIDIRVVSNGPEVTSAIGDLLHAARWRHREDVAAVNQEPA